MNASPSLLDEVVEASGLMSLIAPFTMTRLLVSAGVSPRGMTRADIARALPELERGLRLYLNDEQLAEALSKLGRIAAD